MRKLTDKFGRVHDYLRFSVTDKCNLNCVYCNPVSAAHKGLRKNEMLSVEESYRLIKILIREFGFKKIRFTGGEPLVRKEITGLLENLNVLKKENEFTLAVTTNGTLLFEKLSLLKKSGVTNLNISLDTLDKDKFIKITGKDKFQEVMNSIDMALEFGFDKIKINCVVVKGLNDDEILRFGAMAYLKNINIRFIEYMPFSSNAWNAGNFISVSRMKEIISREYNIRLLKSSSTEVAENYQILGSKGTLSFISSISDHFCDSCNRIRITSEGHLKLCLFSDKKSELDLKPFLRDNEYSDSDISDLIENSLSHKKINHPPIDELIKLKANNMMTIGG